jgi:hypothetical protein
MPRSFWREGKLQEDDGGSLWIALGGWEGWRVFSIRKTAIKVGRERGSVYYCLKASRKDDM